MSTMIKVHREREEDGEIAWTRSGDGKGGNTALADESMKSSQEGRVQTSAQVTLNNDTRDTSMVFNQNHDWYGSVSAFYPSGISPNSSVWFVHSSDPTNGSKGAVLYYGKINLIEYAWLLAWSAPAGSDSCPPYNQVYVETGKQENYNNIDWAVIEAKLNNSTNQSNYLDKITGCSASAEIFTSTNKAAVIAAHFNITI